MYEKNAYETLRWVVARSYTGVDTWTLMMKPEARQKAFLESMTRLCKAKIDYSTGIIFLAIRHSGWRVV